MLYDVILKSLSHNQVAAIGMICSFVLTFITLNMRFAFLPHDKGREFAVNGALSKGKLRGVGIVFVIDFIVCALLFVPLSLEMVIYLLLIFLIMMSGYLDDASEKPWNEYKKGLIDLAISIATMVNFLYHNGSGIMLFGMELTVPVPLYFILGVALIWVAINVTNCSDGVDGLSASLVIVTIMSFAYLFPETLGIMGISCRLFVATLLAYLCFNASPSSMLMGDAGSRSMGFFIAIIAMKSGHPFAYLILSLVLILDGGLGLLKVSLIRFCKIYIFKDIRFPVHDQVRKNMGWSDTQVVIRFVIAQIVLSVLYAIM